MHDLWLSLQLLLLLGVANTAPIVAKRLMGSRWDWPLDAGVKLPDGRPLLGPSKTVRGVVAAIAACALCALLVGLPAMTGVLIGAAAMTGDACSSFIKRRLAIAPSGQAFGIDQVPESLLPLLATRCVLDIPLLQVAAVTAAFVLLEVPLARIAHRLGFREQPY
jgi:CDP-archaeol synthase